MSKEERSEKELVVELSSGYSASYLSKVSDEKLLELYERFSWGGDGSGTIGMAR